uniref:Major sperm protein n=1 Tax=Strongyloides papillosus TaxID=174720 RepID=A0A0N5BCF5_STREA
MTDFPFKLEPSDRVLFSSATLGDVSCSVTLKVINTTKEHQAFKIKCTSNDFFRLRPPVTIVPPGDDPLTVTIVFNAGKKIPESGKHFFAVYGTPCKATDNARETFGTEQGKKAQSKRLFADFKMLAPETDKKEDDKKKEEKKEDEKKEEKQSDEKKEEKPKDDKNEGKPKDDKNDEKKEEKKE